MPKSKLAGSIGNLLKSTGKLIGSLPKQLQLWIKKHPSVREAAIIAGCFVVLVWLNQRLDLTRFLAGPGSLQPYWLALVGLFLYASIRLAILLVSQFFSISHYDREIHRAFLHGLGSVQKAGIDFRNVPLFLVLGTTRTIEQAMGSSKAIADELRHDNVDAPLQIFGNSHALWITLTGISATSAQRLLNERNSPAGDILSLERLDIVQRRQSEKKLRSFLKLLRVARDPVVPVNGIQIFVPLSWLTTNQEYRFSDAVGIDVQNLQDILGVRCLSQILIDSIAGSPGLEVFFEQTPAEARQIRFGCTLPNFTYIATGEMQSLHQWLSRYLRNEIYDRYEQQPTANSNGEMIRFLNEFDSKPQGLYTALANVCPPSSNQCYLGGVYFTSVSDEEQVFYDGIIAQMLSDHDIVIGWDDQSLKTNRFRVAAASVVATAAILVLAYDTYLAGGHLLGW